MDSVLFKLKLYFSLTVAYIKSHFLFFIIGLTIGIGAILVLPRLLKTYPLQNKKQTIALVGNFTVSNLPSQVQSKISFGLTRLDSTGQASSGAATRFITNDPEESITFYLDKNLKWQDGAQLKVSDINYNLKGVKTTATDNTITYFLPEIYAPLPTVLSQPLFKIGVYANKWYLPKALNNLFYKTSLIGLGTYKVSDIKYNSRFVSQLDLENVTTKNHLTYKFYPSIEFALTALKLGQVSMVDGLYSGIDIADFDHYILTEKINPNFEAIIFYNQNNDLFADKNFRQALTYALPDSFSQGEAAESPFSRDSWARTANLKKYPQNLKLARSLIEKYSTKSGELHIKITTNAQLLTTAGEISKSWKEIGIESETETTEVVPTRYDVYLAIVELPADPDQYFLWHSTQNTNYSNYKSPKVDRLLEEGRKTYDQKTRIQKYSDFQKAITEDVPAAFLFYPKVYSVERKT